MKTKEDDTRVDEGQSHTGRPTGSTASANEAKRPKRDVRALNRAIALLRSVVAPHEDDKKTGDHNWRQCRRCLAMEMMDHARSIDDLTKLLEDYTSLLAKARADYAYRPKKIGVGVWDE